MKGGGLVRVEAPDAKALAAALRAAERGMRRELARSNRAVARDTRGWARAAAASGTKLQRRAKGGIGSSADARAARLRVSPTKGAPMARVAFWGAKKRTGWYAGLYTVGSKRQHPEWVGDTWKVAKAGEGPYVINATLDARQDDIAELFLAGQWAALARAVPR